MKFIQSITFKDKIIPLNNKNLIIIGNNGSGKTYILDNIYSEIKKVVSHTDYIKKDLHFKRERIIDEISIAFNHFSNVLELNFDDQKIFLNLIEYIDTYSVHDFLLELKRIDLNEAYLTKSEFYELFKVSNNLFKTYSDINVELALEIIKCRKINNNIDLNRIRVLAYDITYLRNSSLLTFESSDYNVNEDFAFGLSKDYGVDNKINWLLSDEIKNDICDIDKNLCDKENATKWAKFLNNQNRFDKWEKNIFNDIK